MDLRFSFETLLAIMVVAVIAPLVGLETFLLIAKLLYPGRFSS